MWMSKSGMSSLSSTRCVDVADEHASVSPWRLTLLILRKQLLREGFLEIAAAALVRALEYTEELSALSDAISLRMAELGKAKIRNYVCTEFEADDALQSIWSGLLWLDEGLSGTRAEASRSDPDGWLMLSERPQQRELFSLPLTILRSVQEVPPWPRPMHLQSSAS